MKSEEKPDKRERWSRKREDDLFIYVSSQNGGENVVMYVGED